MIRRLKGANTSTKPTHPLQIDRDRSVPGLLDKMEHISFQAQSGSGTSDLAPDAAENAVVMWE